MTTEKRPADDAEAAEEADRADAPRVPDGEDVRVGPDQSDQPQAGAAEPTD